MVAPPGYVQSLVNKIVSNITIICSNLILKYVEEDIVLSVNVKTVTLQSANESWQPAFTGEYFGTFFQAPMIPYVGMRALYVFEIVFSLLNAVLVCFVLGNIKPHSFIFNVVFQYSISRYLNLFLVST